jgi:hypothetical protein
MESGGTEWKAPGQGATILELSEMLNQLKSLDAVLIAEALSHLADLSNNHFPGTPTNLALTGRAFDNNDLRRVATCTAVGNYAP